MLGTHNSGNTGLFNHGLHYQLISYGYHGQNKSESNWPEPVDAEKSVCKGSTGKPVCQLPWAMLLVPAQLDGSESFLSDPQQRLKAMLFIFCQWYSKASTRRSCCESSPTSAQDVRLCPTSQAQPMRGGGCQRHGSEP